MIKNSDGSTIRYVKFGCIVAIKVWLDKIAGIGLVWIWNDFRGKGEN